jgi:hypothetical protein
MSFLSRVRNGWDLTSLSLETINKNKSLLLFPVISVVSLGLVLLTFFGGTFVLFGTQIEQAFNKGDGYSQILGYGLVFTYYLINYFIIVFFNTALIHCAVKTLNEEEASLGEGISFALSKLDKIFGWAVVAATVGTLLQVLQNSGRIGKFVASLLGLGWSILTFFVTPVLVYEDKGVFGAIKESGSIMRQKWGESLTSNVSFGIFNFLGIFLSIVIGIMLMVVNPFLGIAVGLALGLFVATVVSAAQTVFVAAMYNHVKGKPIGIFNGDTLDAAFIVK